MFTGIIDHCGTVERVERDEKSMRLWISSRFPDLVEGESNSVDGTCLTALAPDSGHFRCDVSMETLQLTIAQTYQQGTEVNLERAMRLSDRLGGHFVTGHIDGKAKAASIERTAEYVRMTFADLPAAARRFLLKKGSVAVNGVSLTLNEVDETSFSVMLIPHTLERTNLSRLSQGSAVNLEMDWLVKVVLNDKERAWKEN